MRMREREVPMDEYQRKIIEQRLEKVQKELADLHARWPAHSVKPAMLIQLEDYEEEFASLKELLREYNS